MAYVLYQDLTTVNYTKGNSGRKYIVIHYTGNSTDTAKANANYFRSANRGASAHYFVDSSTVYQVVADANTSWAVGKNYGSGNLFGTVTNSNSISIEMCSTGGKISDATFANTVALTKVLMAKYGIAASNVYRHYDVCSKSCPGWSGWLGSSPTLWNKFKSSLTTTTTTTTPADPDGDVKSGGVSQVTKDQTGKVLLSVHMRGNGWGAWVADGTMAGSTGQNRRIEAIKIKPVKQMDVTVHMKDTGDKKYSNITNSTVIGTVGEKRRIEAIKIESSDTIYTYRVHQRDIGWSSWVTNGQWAGTKSKSKQVEAIELKVAGVVYQAHVQSDGWTSWVADGEIAGTTGKSKRVEAIRINPVGMEIEADAHIQDEKDWMYYGVITKDTIIGTTGKSKRLECLRLKGNIEYRLHIQGTGWTAWTKADGIATMGTVGQALRIEAIQIRKK